MKLPLLAFASALLATTVTSAPLSVQERSAPIDRAAFPEVVEGKALSDVDYLPWNKNKNKRAPAISPFEPVSGYGVEVKREPVVDVEARYAGVDGSK